MKSLDDLRAPNLGNEFVRLLTHLAIAGGKASDAEAMAGLGLTERQRAVLKTAIAMGGVEWASALTEYRQLANGFMDLLRNQSIFFRLSGDNSFLKLPFQTRLSAIYTGSGAGIVLPAQPIAVRKLNFSTNTLTRQRAAAIIIITKELVQDVSAEALVSRELRASVAEAVDAEVVSTLLSGVSAVPSTGEPLTDLRTLLLTVGLTEQSRPYWLAGPAAATRIATVGSTATSGSPGPLTSGIRLFPEATPTGGSLLNIPLLVSSAVPAGRLVLIDAARLAGAVDSLQVDVTAEADVEMSDAPAQSGGTGSPVAPVAAQVTNMWQTNSIAIRCQLYFAITKVQPASVAAIQSIAW